MRSLLRVNDRTQTLFSRPIPRKSADRASLLPSPAIRSAPIFFCFHATEILTIYVGRLETHAERFRVSCSRFGARVNPATSGNSAYSSANNIRFFPFLLTGYLDKAAKTVRPLFAKMEKVNLAKGIFKALPFRKAPGQCRLERLTGMGKGYYPVSGQDQTTSGDADDG